MKCVLCFITIDKKYDKNIISGSAELNVKDELLSLDFDVNLSSLYICRICKVRLKKRRSLITNLREVESNIFGTYSAANTNAKRKNNPCSRALFGASPTKRVAIEVEESQAQNSATSTSTSLAR